MKHYDERDAMALDIAGNYYSTHVSAMTREGLHSKSDIAAELGFRDSRIETLETLCAEAYQVIGYLALEAGVFEKSGNISKVLDNLSACDIVHKDVIPFTI